jgi:hypothetical protein
MKMNSKGKSSRHTVSDKEETPVTNPSALPRIKKLRGSLKGAGVLQSMMANRKRERTQEN